MIRTVHKSNQRTEFSRKLFTILTISLVLAAFLSPSILHAAERENPDYLVFPEHKTMDCAEEGYYIIKDIETKEVIVKTARKIYPGDEYINHENILYRVEKVQDSIAWARSLGRIELSGRPTEEHLLTAFAQSHSDRFLQLTEEAGVPSKIGVYHSHGAEAYEPSDGDAFIDEGGGILRVGEQFVETAIEQGLEIIHTTRTHVPHDAGAYHRSRRTVEELLKDGSGILLDIHRDAVPAEDYIEEVEGKKTVQIQFVVGRQNQNVQTVRQFAESLKGHIDQHYPGLVKGIFMARGNYNQDMSPQSLLLEVGTHKTSREGAKRSVQLFAEATSTYFGPPPSEEQAQPEGPLGETVWTSILWIILISGLGIGIYLVVGTKDAHELRAKVQKFFNREFQDLTGGDGK